MMPHLGAPTFEAAIAEALSLQSSRLALVVSAVVAALPGALLGWKLSRLRETRLREIDWVEAGKPLDWRWKQP